MSAPPYMKLYIADYHGDTTHLDCREHGAYLLLLMAMWRAGGKLPADDVKLAKLAKLPADDWAEIRDTILAFFKRRGGQISHKRILSEIAHYDDVIVKRKTAGKARAEKKANDNSQQAPAHAEHLVAYPEPEPEPVVREDTEAKASASNPDQEAWTDGPIVLVSQGEMSLSAAKIFFGGLLKRYGLEPRDLLGAIGECKANATRDPRSYLTAAAKARSKRRDTAGPAKRVGFV